MPRDRDDRARMVVARRITAPWLPALLEDADPLVSDLVRRRLREEREDVVAEAMAGSTEGAS